MGEDIGIHQTTVCKTFWEVGQRIYAKANQWIKFPSSDLEFNDALRSWQRRNEFPNAIGAIDCTHVPILKPSEFGDEYINRKGFASFNVQAICDGSGTFLNVDCSWPGSVHDSRIWNNSGARFCIEANRCDALIIGDEGYGISPWLMAPYRHPNAPHELNFNRVLSKERVVIERAFGQLKARFPLLKGKVRLRTNKIPAIIVCCFILHNVSKYLNDPDFEVDGTNDDFLNLPALSGGNETIQGQNRRTFIAHQLTN